LEHWGVPNQRRRLETLGFSRSRPGGRWHVAFVQPIDREVHAYFPPPLPDEDSEPPSTEEAVWAYVKVDRQYDVSEIVEALVRDGYMSEVIEQKIDKLVREKLFTRLPNGQIKGDFPF
jgi:site-specific DNA-cytosine methylase